MQSHGTKTDRADHERKKYFPSSCSSKDERKKYFPSSCSSKDSSFISTMRAHVVVSYKEENVAAAAWKKLFNVKKVKNAGTMSGKMKKVRSMDGSAGASSKESILLRSWCIQNYKKEVSNEVDIKDPRVYTVNSETVVRDSIDCNNLNLHCYRFKGAGCRSKHGR